MLVVHIDLLEAFGLAAVVTVGVVCLILESLAKRGKRRAAEAEARRRA